MVSIMKIPFLDLKQQHKGIRREVQSAVNRVFDSQKFVLGHSVQDLENSLARKVGSKYGIGLASGTDALYLSLLALGIGKGDEVITTPFTFFATAAAISRTGARPVFADIDPRTFNLDPRDVGPKITKRTKAILPVHLFGLPCDMDALMKIARKHSLFIVEDAAQSFGAEYKGRQTGSIGDAGCFSFYPTKNLGGAGDGGMVVTSDRSLADKMRLLRDHGQKEKYRHELIGMNSRLDEIQAAVLLVKLKYLEGWNKKRRKIAQNYSRHFSGLPFQTPLAEKGSSHVYHLYSILTERRDALRRHLERKNIGTAIHYAVPLHLQACYKALGYRKGDFPQSEKAAAEILSLPMYPELPASQQAFVIDNVRNFYRS